MSTLVIVTHPNLEQSVINKAWVEALEQNPKDFIVHSLYGQYPDLNYDPEKEQALLTRYENIIFQFPIHWYSTPFALKKYIDEVFTYGWAFGPGGDQLKGKRIGFAVSTGGDAASYHSGISLAQLLNDFILSFEYCGCEITKLHTFYGALFNPSQESIAENTADYVSTFRSLPGRRVYSHHDAEWL